MKLISLRDLIEEIERRGRGEPGRLSDMELLEAAVDVQRQVFKLMEAAEKSRLN